MRPYREYVPDQAFLVPPSLAEMIPEGDPVFFLRDVLGRLDFEPFHRSYRSERGQPPYHPELMVGLYLYGAMRRTYSSRRLAELCQRDVACIYLVGRATPDYHTVGEFRQRFTAELKGLFLQVLVLCREAGLVRLGHVSLDGTKVRANASKHKAMSYGRMLQKEPVLEAEIARWLEEGQRQDAEEDAEHGPDDDGWSLPEELKETSRRLERIRQGKARLEELARQKAVAEGKDPDDVNVPERAQTNFTDPESRIMLSKPDGWVQGYNVGAVVDDTAQVIVATAVTAETTDTRSLPALVDQVRANTGRSPRRVLADAGYASDDNLAALDDRGIDAYIAAGRDRHGTPPPPPRGRIPTGLSRRERMGRKLRTKAGRAHYARRKTIVEPVFGQIKEARGFRRFSLRGLEAVQAEWMLVAAVHNLGKLFSSGRAGRVLAGQAIGSRPALGGAFA